jgi:ABC-type lipoprotein export system ATPase subunit
LITTLTIVSGAGKDGAPEPISRLTLKPGESLAVVGPTGSGKSELLSDIEQLACGDTLSRRRILLDGKKPESLRYADGMVAQLSQKTGFIMDGTVQDFILLHALSKGRERPGLVRHVLDITNSLCGEPVLPENRLQVLSGGQSRALMIADIACISDAPVVLIDEIENAGIDKLKALAALTAGGKITVLSTHDPILTLMAGKRVVMRQGAMTTLYETSPEEGLCLETLRAVDTLLSRSRESLRKGQPLTQGVLS